jgi:hypothetical protein
MNEKIKQLMLEATADMPETYYWPGQYVEKFAELIVKECVDNVAHQTAEIEKWKSEYEKLLLDYHDLLRKQK